MTIDDGRVTVEAETYADAQTVNKEDFAGMNDGCDGCDGDLPTYSYCAVDTETERFDEKKGVTPRNARMIGMSVSYDGAGKTDYSTDPAAWGLMLPEPETPAVFHNAKFDLGVLSRAGLQTPPVWEDTMIAAHLLNEVGDHGLKPLAVEHLGVENPMTFEEADRMRLLNPEVFDEYARNDARYTFRLWPKFQREMERQGLLEVADERTVLVVADWSQMELRILAQYSKDQLLLQAYQSESETDLHTLTASRMFGKTEAEVSKSERSIAKMINFGIAYGITPIGLFNRLRPQGVDVTVEQCEQFIADYFKTYPGVRRFLDQVEPRLRERGYVKNWFGRRRRVSGRTAREVRQAQNFIIQSTAADMAKTAMVRLHKALPEGARLIAMVHDEFIVECNTELADDVRALMIDVMQMATEGFIVPMVVEAKIAVNWGDAK